ncbi:unnamed protein product [Phyllotreta striolata]|uniref:Uncharacterized protein n=1 Tax=Phyllotreta striolata TaxID=444603 RepID=A0A9N9XN63_PHYSR|nr:unnamed protein product [Phyllotreta striolata]
MTAFSRWSPTDQDSMTVVTADEDSGVEMSHSRAENALKTKKYTGGDLRWRAKANSGGPSDGKTDSKEAAISCVWSRDDGASSF